MPSKNGKAAQKSSSRRKVRVAIVGVGNCASSLIQGVQYYRNASENDKVPGLMHVNLGGYHVRDIEFVAAFDIDKEKVGKDLSEAIFSGQNNTVKFTDVPKMGVKVHRGMTLDGLGKYLKEVIQRPPARPTTSSRSSRSPRPTSSSTTCPSALRPPPAGTWSRLSRPASRWSTACPSSSPASRTGRSASRRKGLPIVGDDIKSQVGATIVHRVLTRLFEDRGVQLENTYQLNFGGNTDFLNMLERERLESKKISKTNAVTSQLDEALDPRHVHVGPSDYVPWLSDRKWAFIRLEGKSFGDVPLNVELKLEVHDSPNSAGIVIDAVRFCKLALDNGI